MVQILKYQGEFISIEGVAWRTEIWQDSENIQAIPEVLVFPADKPLLIEWGEADKLSPVQGSSATLTVVSRTDRQYKDMYTVEAGSTRLDIYRNNGLYWSGTLDTELYEEPFSYENEYEVTLTFSDFAILERINFSSIGIRTLSGLINSCLDETKMLYNELKEHISTTCIEITDTGSLLSGLSVNCGNFYDEDGEPMSLREMLEAILRPFGLKMVQRSGKVFIYDLNCIETSFKPNVIEWVLTDAVLGVDKVYKNVKLNFSPYEKTELIKQEVETDNLIAFASGMLVRVDYSTDTNGLMNAPEGFNFSLFHTDPAPPNLTLNKNGIPYKLRPMFSDAEGTGIAWVIKTKMSSGKDYREIINGGLHTYEERLMKINCISFLPYVNDANAEILLQLKMDLLFDVRYNPFEEAGQYNEEGDLNTVKEWTHSLQIPFRLVIRDENGIALFHYQNVALRNYNSGGATSFTGRWMPGEYSEEGMYRYAMLTYIRKDGYPCGWVTNRYGWGSLVNSSRFEKMGDSGEFIPLPEKTTGILDLEIYTGVIINLKDAYDKEWYDNHVRWLLYKTPEMHLVDIYGNSVEKRDVENSSWINALAREELKVETIVGSGCGKTHRGQGIILRANDKTPQEKFTRAGIIDYPERLLLGTIYSNYNRRMNVLSGTIRINPIFGCYTDNHEPGCYLPVSEVQNLIEDESEIKVVQIEPDSYEGLEFGDIKYDG